MKFYQVSIFETNTPNLIYQSDFSLQEGQVVLAPVKNRCLRGVILQEVTQPSFKCKDLQVLEGFFSPLQQGCIRFIIAYYLSPYSLAYGIFNPFWRHYSLLPFKKTFNLAPLTQVQNEALEFLKSRTQSLLFGDTGSGKTEIYIHLIAETINNNQTVLFLMPEISLTPQMERRLSAYFGDMLAFWHSKVTKRKKQSILEGLIAGKIRIIAGARSAFFLPLQNLGLIIVDEEHDDAYKNSTKPYVNVRDLALFLAHKYQIKVVLGSGTPLASSYFLANKNNALFRLKGTHFKAQKQITFVSNTKEIFMPKTFEAIVETLKKKRQILVFLPTRANFKNLVCLECGNGIQCPNCSVNMSVHNKQNALVCHYCYKTMPILETCQNCGGVLSSWRAGTAEVVKILGRLLEERGIKARIAQFDRDVITTHKKLETTLGDFNDNKIDILVGTQMLSKGHDYHNVALCVILGIDYLLSGEDYRSRERAVSLVVQLSGRVGRKEAGEVIIETTHKDFFKPYLADYEVFLQEELQMRKNYYPPFAKLALIRFSGTKQERVLSNMQEVLSLLEQQNNTNVQIVGYGAAPIAKIANKWRYLIFLRATKSTDLIKYLQILLPYEVVSSGSLDIDIDPLDFS